MGCSARQATNRFWGGKNVLNLVINILLQQQVAQNRFEVRGHFPLLHAPCPHEQRALKAMLQGRNRAVPKRQGTVQCRAWLA